MAVLIENPSNDTPTTITAEFFQRVVGPREGIVVTDGLPEVTAAIAGTGLTATTIGVGSGDVTGPGASTDNAFVRFDGLTGKLIQNSNATLSDSGEAAFSSASTTVDAFTITANALNANSALRISSSSANPLARSLVTVEQTGPTAGADVFTADQDGGGAAFRADVTGGTGQSFVSIGPGNTSLSVLQLTGANSLLGASIIEVESNSPDATTARSLITGTNSNVLATQAEVMHLTQEAQNTCATLEVNSIAGGTTAGARLVNTTAATGGSPSQNSPRLELEGQFWDGFSSLAANWNLQTTTGYLQTTFDIGQAATRRARFSAAGLDLGPTSGSGGLDFLESTNPPFGAGARAGRGQFWVRDDSPSVPAFTDDTGTTFVLNTTGSGDVVGPASNTADAVALFDGVTGKLLRDGLNVLATPTGTMTITGTTTGTRSLNVTGDALTTVGIPAASFSIDNTSAAARSVVTIDNANVLATNTTGLTVNQEGPEFSINLTGAAGGQIKFAEASAISSTPAAGEHALWVRDAAPTRFMLRDDDGNDCELAGDDDNTVFGVNAGINLILPNGTNNTFIGENAGQSQTAGNSNTCVGKDAGTSLAGAIGQSENNTAVGAFALDAATIANGNTAIGSSALGAATGSSNTAVGQSAGVTVTTGIGNVLLGTSAVSSGLTTGSNNIGIGFLVGIPDAGALGRIAIGRDSGGVSASATVDDGLFFHPSLAEAGSANTQVVAYDTVTGQMGPGGTNDNLSINADGDMLPTTDEAQDLGTPSMRFQTFHCDRVFAHNTTAGTATLTNGGILAGDFFGVNQANLTMSSTSFGSIAMGNVGNVGAATQNATLTSTNYGSICMGMSFSNSTSGGDSLMQATGIGSMVFGASYSYLAAGTMEATSQGSWCSGYAYAQAGASTVSSTGAGSWVHAFTNGNTASATATNAGQFGVGTNNLADSFQFGNAGLRARLTTGFAAPQNGDFGVDGSGNFQFRSAGVTHNFSVPTVTGSRGGNAALADLLTDLATIGLIVDSTTA